MNKLIAATIVVLSATAGTAAHAAGPVFASYTGSQQGFTDRDAALVQHGAYGTGIDASGIAASAAGHVYLSSGNHLFDYKTDGTLVTDMAFPISTINYTAIAYGNDTVYATYNGSQQGVTVRGLSLNQLSGFDTGFDATGIAVGDLNHLYLSSGNRLYDYLTDGTMVLEFTFPDPEILYTGVAYANNKVFASYTGSQQGVTVRDLGLNQTFVITTDFLINGIAAGDNDNLFLASGNKLYEYSIGGALLNSFTFPDGQINYSAIAFAADVPEPAALGLLGLGVLGVVAGRRRKAA